MGGGSAYPRRLWAVLAIVFLAFVLRIIGLGQGELWFDEALSAVVAGEGWGRILDYTQTAPFEHPPLYYLGLHSWMAVAGASEYALRYFSLFWGVLLVPLLYRFLASWGGHRFALLTALLAGLSTTYIGHSQDARMKVPTPAEASGRDWSAAPGDWLGTPAGTRWAGPLVRWTYGGSCRFRDASSCPAAGEGSSL